MQEKITNAIKVVDSVGFPESGIDALDVKPLIERAKRLRERSTELLKDAPTMAPEAITELNELEARESLGQHLQLVLDDIERRQHLAAYSSCLDDTTTQAITRKSTELTKALITDNLRNGFQDELNKLEFTHLSVAVEPAGGKKGALFHKLVFTAAPGVPVAEVLSEGEARTLSLAAFLTELQTATARSAIVFDDPVSSLDHIWRARIAKRLVSEAATRQVIVFTHDLLFLKYLLEESERQHVEYRHQHIQREGQAGIATPDLPWLAMGLKQRLGVLRNRWQAAEKVYRTDGPTTYERLALEMYRLLRQTWEQAVGEILLNGVIERYRPSIETQKVRLLHDITKNDCDVLDREMAEASRWLHDEPPADGTPLPRPDALKIRIDELEAWVDTIRKRRQK